MTDRAIKLYGTTEALPERRLLTAGPVTATLEAGQLRWIRLGDMEVIRGIAFLIRDRNWSTCIPEISSFRLDEKGGGFTVSFDALCRTGEGELPWSAVIQGRPDGAISFSAVARPAKDFLTCRTGFVVLHPLAGVVGRPMEILHVDGRAEKTTAPELIDPAQCFMDVRAMTHEPAAGIRVTCRMEGDTWETEDHRNWTDASFKTYVRPLALPWPYTIPGGTELRQSVSLTFAGRLPSAPAGRQAPVTVRVGGPAGGTMPMVGLGVLAEDIPHALAAAAVAAAAAPQLLNCRIDMTQGQGRKEMEGYRDLAERLGAKAVLELVIPGKASPAEELGRAAADAKAAGLEPESVVVTPAVDLKSYPPGSATPPAPPLEEIYGAARQAFPGVRLGGGMLAYFPELNRKRPPADALDYVTHGTCALIHAADDRSVMETIEALPHVIGSTRAFCGATPYRIGPSNIGMSANPYGASTTPNPNNGRVTMARMEPRQRGLFGAAWALAYLAQAARGGLEAVSLAAPAGEFGIVHGRRDWPQPHFDELGRTAVFPVFHVIAGMAAAAGSPRVEAAASDPARVAAVAHRAGGRTVLWLASLRPEPQEVTLEGMKGTRIRLLDEESFEAATADPAAFAGSARAMEGGRVTLGAYAVARIQTAA